MWSKILKLLFKMKGSLVDMNGPFLLLNAMRPIEPGDSVNILIAFIPKKESIVKILFWLAKNFY